MATWAATRQRRGIGPAPSVTGLAPLRAAAVGAERPTSRLRLADWRPEGQHLGVERSMLQAIGTLGGRPRRSRLIPNSSGCFSHPSPQE